MIHLFSKSFYTKYHMHLPIKTALKKARREWDK
jgi:hypothetical protein